AALPHDRFSRRRQLARDRIGDRPHASDSRANVLARSSGGRRRAVRRPFWLWPAAGGRETAPHRFARPQPVVLSPHEEATGPGRRGGEGGMAGAKSRATRRLRTAPGALRSKPAHHGGNKNPAV